LVSSDCFNLRHISHGVGTLRRCNPPRLVPQQCKTSVVSVIISISSPLSKTLLLFSIAVFSAVVEKNAHCAS